MILPYSTTAQYNYRPNSMCVCNSKHLKNLYNGILQEKSHTQIEQFVQESKQRRALELAKMIAIDFLENKATKIFVHGRIYTMDDEHPYAEAIAIRHHLIVKVGTLEQVMQHKGAHTEIVDLQGRTLLPGFIDPHIHMCFSMIDHWLDLGPYVNSDMEQVKDKLVKAVPSADPKYLLCGQLFDPQITPGNFEASKEGLDQISQTIGIFILQSNGHVAHVNSAALRMLGFDSSTKDPEHGRFIRRPNGQLTGEVQELAINLFISKMQKVSLEQYSRNFNKFLQSCAAKGCTSLHDCGIGFIDPKLDFSLLTQAYHSSPPVRYSGMLVSTKWNYWIQEGLKPNFRDHMLRINGIKCWADGSTQGGSAFLRDNYTRPDWGRGNPNYSLETLRNTVQLAHDNGWQVGIHANGDAGIDLALQAYEQVISKNPKPELRHRIEHSTICHKQQLYKMKQLGVSPSFLIGHVYFYGHVFQDVLGKAKALQTDLVKSAYECGLRPTLHSDFNCQPVDPLRCIHNAATRKMRKNGQVLNPKQCITVYQAIKAMTINSAWQSHLDDIVGSLEQGKMADFVILQQDPMEIDPNQILDIKIWETWMNGEITHRGYPEEKQDKNDVELKYGIEVKQN